MLRTLTTLRKLLTQTVREWLDEDVSRLGAALAYYALFAIAPVFVIVLAVAGYFFGEEVARRELFDQVSHLVGDESSQAIQGWVRAAAVEKSSSWATAVALAVLFFGATGVFVHLQDSLNAVWGVRRMRGNGLRNFVRDRIVSFAVVLGIGFLLLTSLVISAGLAALTKLLGGVMPAQVVLSQAVDLVVSYGAIALLFSVIFKILPDAIIAWRDVWMGALLTSLLFNVGKYLLGLYIGRTSFSSAYGAAGSVVVVLVWVYYSAQILFFGAKFTHVYSRRHGSHITPARGAELVTLKKVSPREGTPTKRGR